MTPTAVLAIGLDPRFADFSTMPHLTPELVRAYVEAEIARVREFGFDVETRLIAPGEAAEAEIEVALRARSFACVVIGAGCGNRLNTFCSLKKFSISCIG